jgi:hypothetical protein
MVVVASGTTQVVVTSITEAAHIKHMTVLNGATIEARIGIGVQRAERTLRIVAIQSLTDGLGAIVVDANTVSAHGSTAPRAVECHILRTVNVVHVRGHDISGLVDAVIVHILFVARNEANRGNKESDSH